jgi:hypothetical protein
VTRIPPAACQCGNNLWPVRRAESIPTQRVRVEILGVPGSTALIFQAAVVSVPGPVGTRCFPQETRPQRLRATPE